MTNAYNIDAEQQVLGAILFENSCYQRFSDFLRPEHFYDRTHRFLYELIEQVLSEGRLATPVSLAVTAEKIAPLKADGGKDYLIDIASAVPTITSAPEYARIVFELYQARLIEAACASASDMASDIDRGPAEASRLLEETLNEVARLNPRRRNTDDPGWIEGMDASYERLTTISDTAYVPSTGVRELDDMTAGLPPGLMVLAGRPGMGKTTAAWRFMRGAAEGGWGVHMESFEMNNDALRRRAAVDLVRERRAIAYEMLRLDRRRGLTKGDWDAVRAGYEALKELPITVDDGGGKTLRDVVQSVRAARRQHERKGRRLGLVVLDHLGHIRLPGKNNTAVEVGDVCRELVGLAKELQCCVCLCVQLNRGVEIRPNRRPQLSDLRDSGRIEEDADTVVMLLRPEYYLEKEARGKGDYSEERQAYEAEKRSLRFYVEKQREGPTGRVDAWIDARTCSIRDMAEKPSAESELQGDFS